MLEKAVSDAGPAGERAAEGPALLGVWNRPTGAGGGMAAVDGPAASAAAQAVSSGTAAAASGGGRQLPIGAGARQPAPAKPETVKRDVPKVGRNETCPCGSGKKYKHCHGRVA